MSEHAPEPWVAAPVKLNEDWVHIWGASEKGTANSWICQLHGKPERSRADAFRIAECVNACTGMADPAAEIASLRERVRELEMEVSVLRLYGNRDCTAQADEALARRAIKEAEE